MLLHYADPEYAQAAGDPCYRYCCTLLSHSPIRSPILNRQPAHPPAHPLDRSRSLTRSLTHPLIHHYRQGTHGPQSSTSAAGNTSSTAQLVLTLAPEGNYATLPPQRWLTLRLMEAANMPVADPASISVDVAGVTTPGASWSRQVGNRYAGPSVVVSLPPVAPLNTTVVTIEFRTAAAVQL